MRTRSDRRQLDISGNLLAVDGDHPVLVKIEGRDFLPIYSCVEKLEASMAEIGVTQYSIKVIDDVGEFMASMSEQNVPVCRDPHRVGDTDTVRFTYCAPNEPIN